MSVIAALYSTKTGSAWVGSDTMVSSDTLKQIIGPKWVVRLPWAVGVAGHLRTINVFHHHAAELLENLSDAYEFAVRARDLLKGDGYRDSEKGDGPPQFGQSLLLARSDGLWNVGADFSVVALPANQPWAEGTGRELALGAAHALLSSNANVPAGDVVRGAIEAAIALDSTCGGAPWMEELAGVAAPNP
jgi:ATP-dependent protease HslVU (ClpYQ) peptidase subunit